MSTPIDSSSPFSGSTPGNKNIPETPVNTWGFPIHTMQDDLLDLENKIEPEQRTPAVQPINKIESAPIFKPSPKPVIDSRNISSEVVHPYFEQVVAPEQKRADIVEVPVGTINTPENNDMTTSETKSTFYKILIASIVVLVIAIAGLGAYYFLIARTPAAVVEQPSPVEQLPVEVPPTVTAPVEKYSATKANYLPIDLNALSADDIKKSISDVAQELRDEASSTPYEFIVVDNNNNPVAFPIFATAAKINLSSELLNDLGESFSIFLYNDSGNMRLTVVANIDDKTKLPAELSKQEKTFVADASFLFLSEKPEITTGAFSSNNYKNETIRFLNLNKQITLSIDYAISGKQLVIATSKNTIRAVLDKLAVATASTTANAASEVNKMSGLDSDVSVSTKKSSSEYTTESQSAIQSSQSQSSSMDSSTATSAASQP